MGNAVPAGHGVFRSRRLSNFKVKLLYLRRASRVFFMPPSTAPLSVPQAMKV
jgi:hypothetical protein